MNSFFKTGLLLIILMQLASVSGASVIKQLETLELAVKEAISRLEYDVENDFGDSRDNSTRIPLYVEIALIKLGAQELFAEDFYNLSLYIINRRTGHYEKAIDYLRLEYRATKFGPVKHWLNRKTAHLQKLLAGDRSALAEEKEFSVSKEFSDLSALLKRHGVR